MDLPLCRSTLAQLFVRGKVAGEALYFFSPGLVSLYYQAIFPGHKLECSKKGIWPFYQALETLNIERWLPTSYGALGASPVEL